MIHSKKIWEIIRNNLLRGKWVTLEEIYQMIENNWNLDTEDFEWQSHTSEIPKWKRNVRNVLQYRKRKNEILWDRAAKYKII
jgi:DNA-binding GntR family transcriptional regulator